MRKFLVVGCGGSGGATLTYMMDQLRSDLAAHGIEEIPAGWQFLHIDVPTSPDTRIRGIANVQAQGGGYLSTAPSSGQYGVLDNAISQWLGSGGSFGEFGTWAPRKPEGIQVPISDGAGQMRAVGRVITLSRAKEIYGGLSAAFQRLKTVETDSEMTAVAQRYPGVGAFSSADKPVVLVVSSMAGGAGASMALDVCRLLAQVPGVDPGLTGVFMVAPDAFESLPDSARGGVNPNALAMLGEIIATQTNAAEAHDLAILRSLGIEVAPTGRPPFARVFPVGRYVGVEKTLFGDGSQASVYRGLGRGLAALISSGTATGSFVSFDLGNVADLTPANPDFLGWGADSGQVTLPWGAFGFASLSLGRDRYRHYAAQRLARSSADRLMRGHLQQGSTASSVEQLRVLADSQWSRVASGAGLPVAPAAGALPPEVVNQWFAQLALPRPEAETAARRVLDEQFSALMPTPDGTMPQWQPILRRFLADRKAPVLNAVAEAAYAWSYTWSQRLHESLLGQVREATELFGLPYARETIERVERLVRDELLARLGDIAAYARPDIGALPAALEPEFAAMKGAIVNGPAIVDRVSSSYGELVLRALYAAAAERGREVLQALLHDVLPKLHAAVSESLRLLELAAAAAPSASGLANVASDQYVLWPSEEDVKVPERFGVADNEILLTSSEGFGVQYEGDLREAAADGGPGLNLPDARVRAAAAVVSGKWPVAAGASAPGGLLEVLANWRPGMFNRDPFTGSPLTPSQGSYALHVTPADLVERATKFVSRPGEAFEKFCSLSLRDYAMGVDTVASDLPARHHALVAKFSETMKRALPLISIQADAVNAIHGSQPQYRYKFSSIPLKDLPVVEQIEQIVKSASNVAPEVLDTLLRSVTDDEGLTRIDVFGSYRNYSPLVFDALLRPAAQQWTATPHQGKLAFWEHRRSRTLQASLPMSESERRAMVKGWYIGQISGQLRLPAPPYSDAVKIWGVEEQKWLDFPNPLLTPPSQFIGRQIDWLPAVLESYLLAIARGLEAPVLSSLRPYRSLRQLFDAQPLGPATGLDLEHVAGKSILAAWLRDGKTVSGAPSRIDGDSLDARLEGTRTFLEQVLEFTRANFLAAEHVGQASGPFGTITTRRQAAETPIFRDLAPDIVASIVELLVLLDDAAVEARTPLGVAGGFPGQSGFGGGASTSVPELGFGAI